MKKHLKYAAKWSLWTALAFFIVGLLSPVPYAGNNLEVVLRIFLGFGFALLTGMLFFIVFFIVSLIKNRKKPQ